MQEKEIKMKRIKLENHPKLKEAHRFVTKYSDAIIAGGVARNIILGREYNKIDIFVPEPLSESTCYQLYGETFRINKEKEHRSDSHRLFNNNEVDLSIKIMPRSETVCFEELVEQSSIVMDQAWLEPVEGGFKVYSSDLFEQLNKHKIIGYDLGGINNDAEDLKEIRNEFGDDYLLLAINKNISTTNIIEIFGHLSRREQPD